MAKPRVFVSSTYYDLKHIRNSLEAFIDRLGYDSVLFESGDIPIHHDVPLDESCYSEIQNCHMLVLIIGGRYGSPASDSGAIDVKLLDEACKKYNSATKKEYETARERDIPIFIFVEKNVLAEYQTYKENRKKTDIKYVHVDGVNVFRLLDEILAQRRNNFVKEFEKFDDISSWLTDQWGGLFADFLSKRSTETTLKDLASQISELGQISSVLQKYTESIMRAVKPKDFRKIISKQEQRLRASKLRRLANESMVKHVIETSKARLTPSKLYKALEGSDSLESFLQLAGLSKSYIQRFLKEFGEIAANDYARFVEIYLD
jgi:hypothetical protein